MVLKTLIVNYSNLDDAIHYIDTNRSRIRVPDLNDTLGWANKNPKDYRSKDQKIDALLNYLKNDYLK